MEKQINIWDNVAEFTDDGGYILRKATPEEREFLLEKYKKQRIKELEEEIEKTKNLY